MIFVNSLYMKLKEVMWQESFWLPPGVNWTGLISSPEEPYPNFNDLYLPIFFAFGMLFVRFCFEWTLARPLGRALGIKDTYSEMPSVIARMITFVIAFITGKGQDEIRTEITTETSVVANGKQSMVANVNIVTSNGCSRNNKSTCDDDIEFDCNCEGAVLMPLLRHRRTNSEPLASQENCVVELQQNGGLIKRHRRTKSGLMKRQKPASTAAENVGAILKRPKLVQVKSTLDKFAECCWRGTYYCFIFFFGLWALWDKPYFWDSLHCWYGFPFQPIARELWWYYMIEASFYWSLMISQFVDVQRKDFWVNFIHHIATLGLIFFSWSNNVVRAGAITLFIHDCADFWMEGAKMARYTNRHNLCNILFAIFACVWIVTRCIIFPLKLVWTTAIEAPSLVLYCNVYLPMNFLMLVLFVLHVFWSIIILRIAITALRSGQTDDARSEDEGEEDEETVEMKRKVLRKTKGMTSQQQQCNGHQQPPEETTVEN